MREDQCDPCMPIWSLLCSVCVSLYRKPPGRATGAPSESSQQKNLQNSIVGNLYAHHIRGEKSLRLLLCVIALSLSLFTDNTMEFISIVPKYENNTFPRRGLDSNR